MKPKVSHIGLFSGATISLEDLEKTAGFKDKVKLVFVSYGGKELGDGRSNRRGGDPKANTEALKTAGINSHFYVSPNTAHEWQSWRRSLREIAPYCLKTEIESKHNRINHEDLHCVYYRWIAFALRAGR